MNEELIYLYRRKGNESWATCDADRYSELAGNHFFEVRVARHQHDYSALDAERDTLRQQRDKLAGLLLGLKVSVRDRAAGRAILADDVYKLIDTALSELTP